MYLRTALLSLSPLLCAPAPRAQGAPLQVRPQLSVVFWVADLQRSADFFGRVLGTEVVYLRPQTGFGELRTTVPGVTIGLARGKAAGGGGVVPSFLVDDAGDAARRLAALGVETPGGVREMPGLCRLVSFSDPDGNRVQLVQSLLAAPAAAPADGKGDDPFARVRFLIGGWRSEGRGSVAQEIWTQPHGGSMFGTSRTERGERLLQFELLRVFVGDDGGLVYEARPGGGPATRFRLAAHGEGRVTFANPDHDFPRRIHYWREGDALRAAIDDGTDGGRRMEFGWSRLP